MAIKKKKLVIPRFGSEAEDGRWHDRRKRQLESAMEQRIQDGGTLTGLEAVAGAKLRPVTIRLATQDIDTARGMAAQKGIETDIKLLLRQAVTRENNLR